MFKLTVHSLDKYSSAIAGIQGLALSEQARQVTGWRKEGRWEMVELKNPQQEEMEGKMKFHSRLALTEHTFTSLKVHNLKIHM